MSKRRRRLPWGVRIYWVLARRISRQRRSNAELHKAIAARNEAVKARTGQYVWAVRQLRWTNKRLWKEAAEHQATREELARTKRQLAEVIAR